MGRTRLGAFLIAASLSLSLSSPAAAQISPKRLLIIDSQSGEPYESARNSMLSRLAELGYEQASGTLEVGLYSMSNNPDFFRRIVRQEGSGIYGWDLVVVNGTTAAIGALSQWGGDPKLSFYFINVTDPVGVGLLSSLNAPPDRNFTGVAYPVPVRDRLRFLQRVFPSARRIGYVRGEMPQSESYLGWLEKALTMPEFSSLELVSRTIPFVSGENGTRRMAHDAAAAAMEIDGEVDLFLVPNDQMGIDPEYARLLYQCVTKPILGLSEAQAAPGHGAAAAIFSSHRLIGNRAAEDIASLFSGTPFADILPSRSRWDVVFNGKLCESFGIGVPEEYLDKVR